MDESTIFLTACVLAVCLILLFLFILFGMAAWTQTTNFNQVTSSVLIGGVGFLSTKLNPSATDDKLDKMTKSFINYLQ